METLFRHGFNKLSIYARGSSYMDIMSNRTYIVLWPRVDPEIFHSHVKRSYNWASIA